LSVCFGTLLMEPSYPCAAPDDVPPDEQSDG
jgi:hypothetical protein